MSGDQKIKTASGKVPLDLVPLSALKGVARVFGYGAKKYARGNWYRATDDEFGARYAGGALRHLSDAQRPDGTFDLVSLSAIDKESGLPEIDHMICGLLMLRGLCIKRGVLVEDPGAGKEPPKAPLSPEAAALKVEADERYRKLIEHRVENGAYDVIERPPIGGLVPSDFVPGARW